MSKVDEFQQRVAAAREAGMQPATNRKTVYCIGFKRDGSLGSYWWDTSALRDAANGLTNASRELPFELDVPADATVHEVDALVENATLGKDHLLSRSRDEGPYSVVDNTDQPLGQLSVYHEELGFVATCGTLSEGERRLPEILYENARKIADGLNRAYLEAMQDVATSASATAPLDYARVAAILASHDERVGEHQVGYYPTLETLAEKVRSNRNWSKGEVFVCDLGNDQFVIMKQIASASCEMMTVSHNGYHEVLTAYRYGQHELVAALRGYAGVSAPTHASDHDVEAERALTAMQSVAIPAFEEIAKVEGVCTVHDGVLSLPDGTAVNLNRLISTLKGQNPADDEVEVQRPRMRM